MPIPGQKRRGRGSEEDPGPNWERLAGRDTKARAKEVIRKRLVLREARLRSKEEFPSSEGPGSTLPDHRESIFRRLFTFDRETGWTGLRAPTWI